MYSLLLVDDEPDILAAWQFILTSEGYDVRCAHNGAEALDTLKVHLPDLVITDWTMPTMNGAELCRRLGAEPRLTTIPVLVHSAVPLGDSMHPTWTRFLQKPCPLPLFLSTVGQLCAEQRAARRARLRLVANGRAAGGF